jgi:RNA 3'-phosphate cyclase
MGEGGGSIVRIASALAAATKIDLHLYNIRSNRSNPGLRAQHIEAISAIKQFSGCESDNLSVGLKQLSLIQKDEKSEKAFVKVGTAGSIGLVAQAVMFYSFSQKRDLELTVDGGATHGKWAPSVDYIHNVTHAFAELMGKEIDTNTVNYGFYPRGGAKSVLNFKKHDKLSPLQLTEKGELEQVEIFSTASQFLKERNVAERQADAFKKKAKIQVDAIKDINYYKTLNPGSGLTVVGTYSSGSRIGSFVPGERRITAEQVGEMCAKIWKRNSHESVAVDEYAADQLIVPMFLTEGKSEISVPIITSHTKTNIDLTQKFIKRKVDIEKETDCFKIIIS